VVRREEDYVIPIDWIHALLGGGLIGLAASLMMWGAGRIAGISGIFGGLLSPSAGDIAWRVAFVGGLLASGLAATLAFPAAIASPEGRSVVEVGIAGLLVGFGVRLGSGCTSGHGVCGLSRFSRRSLVATLMFIATGVLTVTVLRVLGAP